LAELEGLFYLSANVGETYTWAVEFYVYSDASFNLFAYSAATYDGGACQRSVLDFITGRNLVVNSDHVVAQLSSFNIG
jgi:hypothetical protein